MNRLLLALAGVLLLALAAAPANAAPPQQNPQECQLWYYLNGHPPDVPPHCYRFAGHAEEYAFLPLAAPSGSNARAMQYAFEYNGTDRIALGVRVAAADYGPGGPRPGPCTPGNQGDACIVDVYLTLGNPDHPSSETIFCGRLAAQTTYWLQIDCWVDGFDSPGAVWLYAVATRQGAPNDHTTGVFVSSHFGLVFTNPTPTTTPSPFVTRTPSPTATPSPTGTPATPTPTPEPPEPCAWEFWGGFGVWQETLIEPGFMFGKCPLQSDIVHALPAMSARPHVAAILGMENPNEPGKVSDPLYSQVIGSIGVIPTVQEWEDGTGEAAAGSELQVQAVEIFHNGEVWSTNAAGWQAACPGCIVEIEYNPGGAGWSICESACDVSEHAGSEILVRARVQSGTGETGNAAGYVIGAEVAPIPAAPTSCVTVDTYFDGSSSWVKWSSVPDWLAEHGFSTDGPGQHLYGANLDGFGICFSDAGWHRYSWHDTGVPYSSRVEMESSRGWWSGPDTPSVHWIRIQGGPGMTNAVVCEPGTWTPGPCDGAPQPTPTPPAPTPTVPPTTTPQPTPANDATATVQAATATAQVATATAQAATATYYVQATVTSGAATVTARAHTPTPAPTFPTPGAGATPNATATIAARATSTAIGGGLGGGAPIVAAPVATQHAGGIGSGVLDPSPVCDGVYIVSNCQDPHSYYAGAEPWAAIGEIEYTPEECYTLMPRLALDVPNVPFIGDDLLPPSVGIPGVTLCTKYLSWPVVLAGVDLENIAAIIGAFVAGMIVIGNIRSNG